MSESQSVSSSFQPSASPRQVLLGLFILGQLAFLLLSNAIGCLKWLPSQMDDDARQVLNRIAPGLVDEQGHAWVWCGEFDTLLRHYEQLTGQTQEWSLFAPQVGKATGFPALLLVGDDPAVTGHHVAGSILVFDDKLGHHWISDCYLLAAREPWQSGACAVTITANLRPLMSQSPWDALIWHAERACRPVAENPSTLLLSDNEPVDIHAYIRWGNCRLRRYEGMFYIDPQPISTDSPAEIAQRASRRARQLVQEHHGDLLAYARWRLKSWQCEHPDAPAPTQIILLQRAYRIHDPDESRGWDGPNMVPLARWQLMAEHDEAKTALEPYDFTQMRFVTFTP